MFNIISTRKKCVAGTEKHITIPGVLLTILTINMADRCTWSFQRSLNDEKYFFFKPTDWSHPHLIKNYCIFNNRLYI